MTKSQLTADLIKTLARSKGISVSKLLSECELNKNALYTMQSEGYYPRVEALNKIADRLDCSIDYLLGRTDNPNAHKAQANGTINQSNVNSDNSTVNINSAVSGKDSIMSEFMEKFSELPFDDKIKAMEFVSKLKNK